MSDGRGNFQQNGNGQRRGRNRGNYKNRNAGGNWQNKQSYGNANRDNRNNNNSNSSYNAEEGFSKFRDPQQQQHRQHDFAHMRQRRNSYHGGQRRDGHSRGGDWYGNNQNREPESNAGFDNREQFEQSASGQLPALMDVPVASPITVAAFAKASTPAPAPATPAAAPAAPVALEKEDKKPLLHKIKKEKLDHQKETKPPPSPNTSSTSSSSSGESKSAKEMAKAVLNNAQRAQSDQSGESKPKANKKLPAKPASSSSSSSSSSEESSSSSEEEDSSEKEEVALPPTPEKPSKTSKKKSKRKQASEEDLVCLGKLEKNFIIEDEDEIAEGSNVKADNVCILCDKTGHSAFHCQMICKNCAAPYHNHKSCPQPPNLTVMMQCFMEFCMSQLWQYNPEQKFSYVPNITLSGVAPAVVGSPSLAPPGKRKRVAEKAKPSAKKVAKRKRAYSESDEEEQQVAQTDTSSGDTSSSDSEDEKSSKVSSKSKKRSPKVPDYHSSFGNVPPPFTSFPAFGAAAAAYNPLLFGQMMHGAFPPPTGLNFK